MFKLIVAGGRDFNNYDGMSKCLDRLLKNINDNIEIVCGMARGADRLGERYEDIPKYVYGTTMESMEIDANQMLQQAEEDSDVEDFYFDDAGAKELREFVKQWNAKYAKSYYSWNDKVVVMLPPEYQKERVND